MDIYPYTKASDQDRHFIGIVGGNGVCTDHPAQGRLYIDPVIAHDDRQKMRREIEDRLIEAVVREE